MSRVLETNDVLHREYDWLIMDVHVQPCFRLPASCVRMVNTGYAHAPMCLLACNRAPMCTCMRPCQARLSVEASVDVPQEPAIAATTTMPAQMAAPRPKT